MLSTVLVTLAVLVGGAVAETIVYCGSQPYYPSQVSAAAASHFHSASIR